MSNFKCNDCGHVFAGNFATQQCPNCGSTNFKKAGTDFPWKKILIVLGAILALILLIMLFTGGNGKMEAYLTNDDQSVKIEVKGISENDLRKNYKVKYSSNSDQNNYQQLLFGNEQTARVSVATLIEGETYTFYVVERNDENGMKEPDGLKWKTTNQYTRPLPPSPPKIRVETSADCHSGTYTVTVKVIEGWADEFVLDDIRQTSAVFTGVQGRKDDYFASAIDMENGLTSNRVNVSCRVITPFHVTEQIIQDVFSKVGSREMRPGDAMKRINNSKDVKLFQSINGLTTLEEVLNYAYENKIHYFVKNVSIISDDCFDKVSKITIAQ